MDAHVVPPPVQMVQMLAGFQISQALYVAAGLGVADRLVDGPRPVGEIAAATGAHAPSLYRVLRTLSSLGVFTEPTPGCFALTPLGQTLTTDHPSSMRDLAIVWMETHYTPFARLTDTVRTGAPAADLTYGVPFFDWLAAHPEHASRFTGAMANLTDGIKHGAIAALRLQGIRTLVDVGGADGTVLASVLAGHPDMAGVLLDLPHVVAEAPKTLAARGVTERVTCVGGDFFTSVPAGDGYLFSMVLHDWDDEASTRLLRNVAAAGGPGAQLVLVEFVVPSGEAPHMSKMIDLTMLGMLTGCERGESEWCALLTAAGFDQIEITSTPTPLSIIRAVAR